MLVRSRFPEDGDHTGGDVSPSVSRVTNRDSSRGPLVIDTIVHRRADHISRRRHRQYARGRAVFPRRRPGAKSQPYRRRFAKVRR